MHTPARTNPAPLTSWHAPSQQPTAYGEEPMKHWLTAQHWQAAHPIAIGNGTDAHCPGSGASHCSPPSTTPSPQVGASVVVVVVPSVVGVVGVVVDVVVVGDAPHVAGAEHLAAMYRPV
jgi:hypothetical protein